MIEIPIADAPDQIGSVILGNRRCTFRFRYAQILDRWSFDLSIDDAPVLHGRSIVIGRNLLEGYGFGIGAMIALPTAGNEDAQPGRDELPMGLVRIYHVTEAELAAA